MKIADYFPVDFADRYLVTDFYDGAGWEFTYRIAGDDIHVSVKDARKWKNLNDPDNSVIDSIHERLLFGKIDHTEYVKLISEYDNNAKIVVEEYSGKTHIDMSLASVIEDLVCAYPMTDDSIIAVLKKHPFLLDTKKISSLSDSVFSKGEFVNKIDNLLSLFICYLVLVWDLKENNLEKFSFPLLNTKIRKSISDFLNSYEANFDERDVDYDSELDWLKKCRAILEDNSLNGFCNCRLHFGKASEYTVYQNAACEIHNGKYSTSLYDVYGVKDHFSKFEIMLKKLIVKKDEISSGYALAKCKSCGNEFIRSHGNVKFCEFCRSGSQRTRECRERQRAKKREEEKLNGKP